MNEIVPQTLPLTGGKNPTTSGTIGSTVIDVMSIIESAARRCGIQPTALTPENQDTARNNLFMLLSKLTNRGINLWTVEQFYMSVVPGQIQYALPHKTEEIAGIVYRTVPRLPGTLVLDGAAACGISFSVPTKVSVVGFKFANDVEKRLIIEYFDGTNWIPQQLFQRAVLSAGWHWYQLNIIVNCTQVRVRDLDGAVVTLLDFIACSEPKDLPMSAFNRDEYTQLNNKTLRGRPNSFYFEKRIESYLTFWPVPQEETAHFMVWRCRSVQDVGSLMNKLEVPDRWLNAITWMLAKNLGFELPGVDPTRLQLCVAEAQAAQDDAELGESDGTPMFIQPNISRYTA